MGRTVILAVAGLALSACTLRVPEERAVLAERYCYRTLGVVDCHAAPLPDEDYRRVGFFDAPVAVIAVPGPYTVP